MRLISVCDVRAIVGRPSCVFNIGFVVVVHSVRVYCCPRLETSLHVVTGNSLDAMYDLTWLQLVVVRSCHQRKPRIRSQLLVAVRNV